jgi:hypothetical protein
MTITDAAAYITMYDAIDVNAIPNDAACVAGYTDGNWPNITAMRARFPHANLLTITVTGGVADCCDCEVGDLTVAQADEWVKARLAAGQYRPCVYANSDRWLNQDLLAGLAAYGGRIRRWVAAYPGSGANVPDGFDAHQWASTQTLDTSVCLPGFFDPEPAPKPAPPAVHEWSAEIQVSVPEGSTGTLHFHGSVNLDDGDWTAGGLPGVPHWSGAGGGKWRIRGLSLNDPPLG